MRAGVGNAAGGGTAALGGRALARLERAACPCEAFRTVTSTRPAMTTAIARALDLVAAIETAPTAQAVGRALLEALRPYGARGIFAGSFPILPERRAEDVVAGRHVFAQVSPAGWLDGYQRRSLDPRNPVIFGPARRAGAFRWSDPGFDDLRGWAGLDLAREVGVEDGLAVPWHGPGPWVGVVSLGFERYQLAARDQLAVILAAGMAYERMSALAPRPHGLPAAPALTRRERDCLAFVAEGLSDAEIGERLGIAQVTAHAHVENAKRKLGARTRAQAVARFFALGLA